MPADTYCTATTSAPSPPSTKPDGPHHSRPGITPQVHETVRALARADKRRTDTLANFVGWLGITA